MNARLSIILLTAVTLLSSCSVGDKLDRTLDEVHAMNENMAAMNKSMDTNMQAANQNMAEANKSFATLVDTMKPEEWIDQLSSKFQETLAQITDGTGDIQSLIKNGSEVSLKLNEFLSKFSTDDLKDLSSSIKQMAALFPKVNDFIVNNSDNIAVLTQQMKVMPQLFITMEAGMGMIDMKNVDGLIASVQSNESNPDVSMEDRVAALDVLSSSEKTSAKVISLLSKDNLQYAANNSYLKAISDIAKSFNTDAKNVGGLKKFLSSAGTDAMGNFWSLKDSHGKIIPMEKFFTCLTIKLVTDLFDLTISTPEGKGIKIPDAHATVVGPDADVSFKGPVVINGLSIKTTNANKIKDAYKTYCKDIASLDFTK